MSQRARILAALQVAGHKGVCMAELEPADRYTARNRLSTLRAEGYAIRSTMCRVHPHRSGIKRYYLQTEPEQMDWTA